jgi:acetolactate synthase-1/2/3 large subunit
VVFANNSYRILNIEMMRTGSGPPGPQAARLFDLTGPVIDWVALARGMGVPAVRCEDGETFDAAFARAMAERGPMLIEAAVA